MARYTSLVMGFITLIVLAAFLSLFTVYQADYALVLQLGKIKTDAKGEPIVLGPGLHAKWPFIDQVVVFDGRIQTLEVQDSRIFTAEKKAVIVNSYVKWRIRDVATFYKATRGDIRNAQILLEQKVNDGIRGEFGRYTIAQVVSGERLNIMGTLQGSINQSANSLGLDVVDVRVKRIDLPPEVSEAVYSRMRAEREKDAAEHRAKGQGEAERIRAETYKDVTILVAQVDKTAKEVRGKADAAATGLYSQAYNKNAEFFAFYQSLKSYKGAFNSKDDILVLSPDADFFKYFEHVGNGS